ncbi:MAG: peptidase inhibitor family I36 protein [Bifidobacteriaceae bacterium]|jgi:hypothetical protein|nr:peptidase inhibitor family I36 protein [Bifidobacteriaceae bacterium]
MAALIVAAALTTIGIGAVQLATAESAYAASCTGAMCLYENTNYGGSRTQAPTGVCAIYPDLKNQSFNDKASSITNRAKYTQSFWIDKNYAGSRLNVAPYVSVANLKDVSWNDKISSAITTG